jgi:hypothetical protein
VMIYMLVAGVLVLVIGVSAVVIRLVFNWMPSWFFGAAVGSIGGSLFTLCLVRCSWCGYYSARPRLSH